MNQSLNRPAPYHDWSEIEFDWAALNEAAFYLDYNCRKWGRLGIWTKEKFGTLRVSTTCAFALEYNFLHSLFFPGYSHICWPKWFSCYVDRPVGKILGRLGVIKLINKYQLWILKRFWLKAAKKWPHIKDEILDEFEENFHD